MLPILILIGCVKIFIHTGKPFLWAEVYLAAITILPLLIGYSFLAAIFNGIIMAPFVLLYFWLLDRFEDSVGTWWLIYAGGLLLVFVLPAFFN